MFSMPSPHRRFPWLKEIPREWSDQDDIQVRGADEFTIWDLPHPEQPEQEVWARIDQGGQQRMLRIVGTGQHTLHQEVKKVLPQACTVSHYVLIAGNAVSIIPRPSSLVERLFKRRQ